MKKKKVRAFFCKLALLTILTTTSQPAKADSYGYEILSNFGRTGLLEVPTAYVQKDGYMAFGSSYVYPYLRVFGNVGFFPGLELGGDITEIKDINLNQGIWKGYGNYKDKAFFAKYQILPERATTRQ